MISDHNFGLSHVLDQSAPVSQCGQQLNSAYQL